MSEKSEEYLTLDGYLLNVKMIQRLCSHNHNMVEPKRGYEDIWMALDKAAEEIRKKMQEVRYGQENGNRKPERGLKGWQKQVMAVDAARAETAAYEPRHGGKME